VKGRINGVDECKPKTKKEEAETLENQDDNNNNKTVQKMIFSQLFCTTFKQSRHIDGTHIHGMGHTNVS
jgi:hypothetical protein